MIQIDDKILSMDIIEEKFVCDLGKCKGNCCVLGASGAPLEDDEVVLMKEKGIQKKQGNITSLPGGRMPIPMYMRLTKFNNQELIAFNSLILNS